MRRRGAVRAVAVPVLLAAAGAGAAGPDRPAPGHDPIRWPSPGSTPQAPAVALTVRVPGHRARPARVQGRRLLAGSQEMYLRSATAGRRCSRPAATGRATLRRLDLKVGDADLPRDRRQPPGGHRRAARRCCRCRCWTSTATSGCPGAADEQVVGPRRRRTRGLGSARPGACSSAAPDYNVTGLRVEILGRTTAVHIACRDALGYRTTSPRPGIDRAEDLRRRGRRVAPCSRPGGAACCWRRAAASTGDDAVITFAGRRSGGPLPHLHRRRRARDRAGAGGGAGREPCPSRCPAGRPSVNIDQGPVDVTHEVGGAHGGRRPRPRRPRRGRGRAAGHPREGREPGRGPGAAALSASGRAT